MLSILSDKNKDIFNAAKYFESNKRLTITQCAKVYGINRQTLSNKLKELDMYEDRRKYKFNEKFFESIDCEQKAYWLGFLLADGCLKSQTNKISIRISCKDIKHLVKFKNAINSNHPIRIEKTVIKDKGYDICSIGVESSKTYNDLISLKLMPQKSKNEICYENIRVDLIPHYIRGIYDGDGWLSKNSNCTELGFGMSYEALEFIKKSFEKYALVKEYKIKPYKGIFRYRITSKVEIIKALKYMYFNSTVSLDRKYEKYLKYCRLK